MAISDRDTNWDNSIDPRINELRSKGYYLEAFYLCLATIEYTLQEAIQIQENWINKEIRRSGVGFKVKTKLELEEMTLGSLIKLFSRYNDDEKLISQLNQINSFRKKSVHKLLDHSIEKLNREAQTNFVTYFYLVSKLHRYMIWLREKMIRSLKRRIRKNSPVRGL